MINNSLFLEYVEEAFKWLSDLGYKQVQLDQSIFFERARSTGKEAISFSWAEYDRILVFGIIIYKRLDEVERVLDLVLDSNSSFTIKTSLRLPPMRDIEVVDDSHHVKNSFFISCEKDVYTLSQAIQNKFILVENFFSEFNGPKMISRWLQKTEINDHSSLIVSDNNSFMLRKLVIMKEAKHEGFTELFSQYTTFLESKNEANESPYTSMYRKFKKLLPYFTDQNLQS